MREPQKCPRRNCLTLASISVPSLRVSRAITLNMLKRIIKWEQWHWTVWRWKRIERKEGKGRSIDEIRSLTNPEVFGFLVRGCSSSPSTTSSGNENWEEWNDKHETVKGNAINGKRESQVKGATNQSEEEWLRNNAKSRVGIFNEKSEWKGEKGGTNQGHHRREGGYCPKPLRPSLSPHRLAL